jgi:hypothetical protein
MSADALIKFNPDTQELQILSISARLFEAIEAHGSVLVAHEDEAQSYEIYKENGLLKVQVVDGRS